MLPRRIRNTATTTVRVRIISSSSSRVIAQQSPSFDLNSILVLEHRADLQDDFRRRAYRSAPRTGVEHERFLDQERDTTVQVLLPEPLGGNEISQPALAAEARAFQPRSCRRFHRANLSLQREYLFANSSDHRVISASAIGFACGIA
jgi:hypothetical protein